MPPQGQPTFQAPKTSKAPLLAALFAILFLGTLIFGVWAYQGKQSAQSDSNKAVATAVAKAKAVQQATDQAAFADQLKQPYKTFTGPATYGSIKFSYPKNWSVYTDQPSSTQPISAYFYPDIVPSISGSTAFALRVELVSDSYSNEMNGFQSQVEDGSVKVKAYVPLKLANAKNVQRGSRVDGAINTGQSDSMVVIPVRDQTLKISTQSATFLDDFNKIVLPSLTFSP